MLPTFNTGSEVGYGVTIASLAAFAIVKQAVLNVAPGNPLLSEVVAVNVLAGITGSASGGLSIALEALGDTYFQLAQQYHIPLEWMHRLASMASGGFDTLPHNGAVITLLTICGLTHRASQGERGKGGQVTQKCAGFCGRIRPRRLPSYPKNCGTSGDRCSRYIRVQQARLASDRYKAGQRKARARITQQSKKRESRHFQVAPARLPEIQPQAHCPG